MGRGTTVFVATQSDAWEYWLTLIVDRCDLIRVEVSVPWQAFAM